MTKLCNLRKCQKRVVWACGCKLGDQTWLDMTAASPEEINVIHGSDLVRVQEPQM